MIPAAFAYARPTTLDEALQAVASGGEDVKIMAGGQSLIPVMRLRLAAPETVVDLTKVAELRGVRDDGLMTTVLPAARAAPSFQTAMMNGKFQGAMEPTTPMGRRTSSDV